VGSKLPTPNYLLSVVFRPCLVIVNLNISCDNSMEAEFAGNTSHRCPIDPE